MGVMLMRLLENGLVIPSTGKIQLKPGRYHLMFLKLKQQMIPMYIYQVIVTFKNSGSISIPMTLHKMSYNMKYTNWVCKSSSPDQYPSLR